MAFFSNKRKDFSIQPPKQEIANGAFSVIDSANIDFTYSNNDLTANLTQTGIIAGTYGDATHIPILVLDAYGRVTGVSTTTFSAAGILLQTNGVTNPTQTILNLVAGTNMTITDDGLGNITFASTGGGGGSGTVTSVSAGTGMNFSTITSSGSVAIDTSKVPYLASGFSTGLLKWNGSAWVFDTSTYLTTISGLNISLLTNDSGYITSAALTGYVPNTRNLSINGTSYNLSADRTWTVGDVFTSGSYADPLWITSLAYSKLTGAPTIPTVGSWGALNYPTWVSGTPFVKMTAAGTFALDSSTYLSALSVTAPLTTTGGVTPTLSTSIATKKIVGRSTAGTGVMEELTVTKSVDIVSGNVELVNDETSPTARKFYAASGVGAKGWRFIEQLDLPVAVQNASYPYTAQEYVTGGNAILKVAGSNIMFVATGNTVLSIDSVTGETLFTTAVTAASGLVYVAQTNQVWAFGSLALVYRFTPSTGAFVASNTVTGLTDSCKAIYDDSAVSGNVYAYQSSTMNIINHSTYARTAVASGTGNTAQELVKVTGGAQAGLLVGGCANGIFAFNPATNLFVYGPGAGVAANFVKYVASIDRFVISSIGNQFLQLVQPTSSTTLSILSTLRGVQAPNQFIVDDSINRVFALGGPSGAGQMRVSVIELSASALTWVKSDVLSQTTGNGFAVASHDLANKTFYAAGTTSAKIVYA
jgi:hypothetical protein